MFSFLSLLCYVPDKCQQTNWPLQYLHTQPRWHNLVNDFLCGAYGACLSSCTVLFTFPSPCHEMFPYEFPSSRQAPQRAKVGLLRSKKQYIPRQWKQIWQGLRSECHFIRGESFMSCPKYPYFYFMHNSNNHKLSSHSKKIGKYNNSCKKGPVKKIYSQDKKWGKLCVEKKNPNINFGTSSYRNQHLLLLQ